jgi:hypothetical protein
MIQDFVLEWGHFFTGWVLFIFSAASHLALANNGKLFFRSEHRLNSNVCASIGFTLLRNCYLALS